MSGAQIGEPTSGGISGVVRLRLILPARVDLERVPATFGRGAADRLGEPAPDIVPGIRRFSCDLELRVSPDGWLTFHKSALVGLGEPARNDAGWAVPIEW